MPSVTRKSSSTRQARRARVVAQLLDVVEELLTDGEPFAEISVERLITKANISRSTFYVYFEDKGVLLLALAEDVVEQLVGSAQSWWDLPPDAGQEDIEAALREIIDVYLKHQLLWGALVEAASYDRRVAGSFRQVVDAAAAGLTQHIKAGQKQGHVRPGLDPKRTAQWLTWMTERGLHQLVVGASRAEVAKLCKAQAEIVWCTLYEGAPNRGTPAT